MRLKLKPTLMTALAASAVALSTATTALAEYPERPIQAIVLGVPAVALMVSSAKS